MIKLVLIGTGNIAQHLFSVLQIKNKAQVIQVVGRNPKTLSFFSSHTKTTTDFNTILDAALLS